MAKKKYLRYVFFITVIIFTTVYQSTGLYAQKKNPGDGSGLIGVWEDGETHNLITIKQVNGVPAAVSVIDQDDASTAEVVSNSFKDGILEFKYFVPSTGYNVTITTISLDDKGLNYRWNNEHNSGNDTLKRMMDIVSDSKISSSKIKKGKLIGKIYKINKDEIIIAVADTSSSLKMGDKLFVIADDTKIVLDVSFPMMTISRCKISGTSKQYLNKIKLNTQVYK